MKAAEQRKLKDIEGRVRDLYKSHGADIESGTFLRLSAGVAQEMKWLCEQLRVALGRGRAEFESDGDEAEAEAAQA